MSIQDDQSGAVIVSPTVRGREKRYRRYNYPSGFKKFECYNYELDGSDDWDVWKFTDETDGPMQWEGPRRGSAGSAAACQAIGWNI